MATKDGLQIVIQKKRAKPFSLRRGVKSVQQIVGDKFPALDEVYKFISLSGGFSSICFILWVASHEPILELTASTLRIGAKQFGELCRLRQNKKLFAARFFVSNMMIEVDKKSEKYNYADRLYKIAQDNGWQFITVNNHSKIILMRTANNFFVLETSSNLNENPKIEQYSFEDDKELYQFYYGFFNDLQTAKEKTP